MSEMMKMAAGIILSLACASCGHSFLQACRDEERVRSFWFKGAAGLCFVALGLLGASLCAAPGFAVKTVAALMLGLAGDQLLALRFIKSETHDELFVAGAVAFTLGHGLYIWALLSLVPGALVPALALALPLYALSVFILKRNGFDAGRLTAGAYLYILAVVLMGAVALAAAIRHTGLGTLLFALGGLSFIASDDTLCVFSYGRNRSFVLNRVLHITYYAAQLLIAWSLFFIS